MLYMSFKKFITPMFWYKLFPCKKCIPMIVGPGPGWFKECERCWNNDFDKTLKLND